MIGVRHREDICVPLGILAEKDLALINAVQAAPRISWAQAAEILDSHPTALAQRWQRLHADGIVWVTAQFTGRSRQQVITFCEVSHRPDRRDALVEALMEVPEIMSMDVLSHNNDLGLTIVDASMSDVVNRIYARVNRLEGVNGLKSMVVTAMHSAANSWSLRALDRWQLDALAQVQREQFQLDRSVRLGPEHIPVIELLQRDGRCSAADVARATGQSPATARRHLAKVLSSGVVALRCDMAQAFSGFPITVQWFARLPASEHVAAVQRLNANLNMRMMASTTGRANLLLTMWLSSVNDILATERAIELTVPSIEILESAVLMQPLKRVGWVLNPDTTASGRLIAPSVSVE